MTTMRRLAILFFLLSYTLARAQAVHIGVLGLFHPQEFKLRAPEGSALVIRAGRDSFVLEGSSSFDEASFQLHQNEIVATIGSRSQPGPEVVITSRMGGACEFLLSVPGKITRRYRGILRIKPAEGTLVADIQMDLETAVASVVAAESASDTPLEAEKAQAIAARSYFVAGARRHHSFDYCDTTHCQFLREAPAADTIAARATSATRGLVLIYNGRPIAAMYTRSCGGRTYTPEQLGITIRGYPYFSVDCPYCRQHPVHWQTRISMADARLLQPPNEGARLQVDRRLGWEAIASNNFSMRDDGSTAVVEGTGTGHGIGLCQAGSKAMAEEGKSFDQILRHYYPDTTIRSLSAR
jgi:peptidoglycan hydrolase-like amidase